jgi:lipoprotein NlpI
MADIAMARIIEQMRLCTALLSLLLCTAAGAQAQAAKSKELARAAKAAPAPAETTPKGYRVGPRPAWVVAPPNAADSPAPTAPAVAGAGSRRELLIDQQVNHALPKTQMYFRHSSVAIDAAALGSVSQRQIGFNPAFQSVVIHEAYLIRDGRRADRLKDARVELMRRETQLEKQAIDGTETLLVVFSDVRLGDAVELAYTIEGENPIFEGRVSGTLQLAWESPIELLHHRVIAPAGRTLQTRGIGGDAQPEQLVDGKSQVLRILRRQVAAVADEQGSPPWFKVYPAWQYSEFTSWSEVDAWAQRLFASTQAQGPALRARIDSLKRSGMTGEALVAEALRFVQDEVRYFSVSLGESSHRPKPAERTLTDLLGDCKDKVVLLNVLLNELGFDAKPALVSLRRNRGLASYLPSHDQFDHVITRLDLNGRSYFLDATINGQGTTLAGRGYFPYGQALVVGVGTALQEVADGPHAIDQLDHEQRWDFSKLGAPVRLTTLMRARGLTAERWRSALAAAGEQRLTQSMAGAHARTMPGLKALGSATVKDDRQSNVFEMSIEFEHPSPGRYSQGALDTEFTAVELFDVLQGPPEARRRSPFMFDAPRLVVSRIEVLLPRPMGGAMPPVREVNDRHFLYSSRVETASSSLLFVRRVERRADEVLPANLTSFRENLLRARQLSGNSMRMALVETQGLAGEFERIDRKLRGGRDFRDDQLARILMRNEVARVIDGEVLRKTEAKSPLSAQVLAARAQSANLLGEFGAGLIDAEAALRIDAASDDATEARAVALLGSGKPEQALEVFKRLAEGTRRTSALKWMGAVEIYLGHHAEAEKLLRGVIDGGSGDDRDFALLWLYVAAEYQGGRGKTAIAPFVDGADANKLPGAMLHFLDGRLDRDTLLKRARERADMERLNLAEAYFYIGQQLAARGQRDEALRWFTRSVETNAVPYREVTFAQLELKRGR